jgi:hypothetical protein
MDVRATYCSSACKQAAYRRRLQQSEMSRQGSLCNIRAYRVEPSSNLLGRPFDGLSALPLPPVEPAGTVKGDREADGVNP